MDFSDGSHQSLIPSFLYYSSSKTLDLQKILNRNSSFSKSPSPFASIYSNGSSKAFDVPAQSEPRKIKMYSPAFYAACTVGGILSYCLTHMVVVPAKYKCISFGFGVLLKEQSARGFFRGWVPTLLGYSALGSETEPETTQLPEINNLLLQLKMVQWQARIRQ